MFNYSYKRCCDEYRYLCHLHVRLILLIGVVVRPSQHFVILFIVCLRHLDVGCCRLAAERLDVERHAAHLPSEGSTTLGVDVKFYPLPVVFRRAELMNEMTLERNRNYETLAFMTSFHFQNLAIGHGRIQGVVLLVQTPPNECFTAIKA